MSRTTRRRARARLHRSPLAVALDGSLFGSVGMYDGVDDAESAIRAAVEHGGRVFVGVELRDDEVDEMRKWLHDAAFESVAFILGARPRGRKRKASGKE